MKNVLILGGSSGFGKSITEDILKSTEHLVLFTFFSSKEKANQITEAFPNSKSLHLDFENEESINNGLDRIQKFSPDVIINNATVGLNQNHSHKLKTEDLVSGFQKNIIPLIQITNFCIKIFRKKKSGKIITILSSYIIGNPPIGMAQYTAEKNYLYSFVKSWAIENAKFGITSNAVSPSIMKTNLTNDVDDRIWESIENNFPLKRILTPEEAAETVTFLVNCSDNINGVNIPINQAKDVI